MNKIDLTKWIDKRIAEVVRQYHQEELPLGLAIASLLNLGVSSGDAAARLGKDR